MKAKSKRKPMKKHWYKRYISECPVCGGSEDGLVRVYGKKPKNPSEWIDYRQNYDWCNEFGSIF